MKKLSLHNKITKCLCAAIMLLVLAVFTLTGCSSTPTENLLSSSWNVYERLTYNVVYTPDTGDVQNGVYVSEIETLVNKSGATISINGENVTYTEGYHLTTSLAIGSTTIASELFFHKINNSEFFYPAVGFVSKTVDGEVVLTQKNVFDGANKKINVTTVENGESSQYTLSYSKLCYDNISLYYIIRTLPLSDGTCSLTFDVPMHNGELASLTAAASTTSTETIPALSGYAGKENIDCYYVSVSRNTSLSGLSYQAYYAKDNVTVDGITVKKLPVKLAEGNAVYTLSAISTTR